MKFIPVFTGFLLFPATWVHSRVSLLQITRLCLSIVSRNFSRMPSLEQLDRGPFLHNHTLYHRMNPVCVHHEDLDHHRGLAGALENHQMSANIGRNLLFTMKSKQEERFTYLCIYFHLLRELHPSILWPRIQCVGWEWIKEIILHINRLQKDNTS